MTDDDRTRNFYRVAETYSQYESRLTSNLPLEERSTARLTAAVLTLAQIILDEVIL